MTHTDAGAAGMQPESAQGGRKALQDGIIQLSGTVSFTAAGAILVVEIEPPGAEGSAFSAYGAQGNTIPAGATPRPAVRMGDLITADGLPPAAVNTNYTVELRYTAGATPRAKRGTVSGNLIDRIPKENVPITLT